MALVRKDSESYFISKTGQIILRPDTKYSGYQKFSEGLAAVDVDGKDGYMNRRGELVIPAIYEYASDFHEGLAAVRYDGKYGFIDTNGELKIPFMDAFDVGDFLDGAAWVSTGTNILKEQIGFIDKTGRWVVKPLYNKVDVFGFSAGVCWVALDGKCGILKNPLDVVSPWAADEVNTAIQLGIVPKDTDSGYALNVTRQQFSHLLVALVEKITGEEMDAGGSLPFYDTADLETRKVAAAGIIKGVGNGLYFRPKADITREELATMLVRALSYIELKTGQAILPESTGLNAYTDSNFVSAWAVESIDALIGLDIMQGVTSTTLAPQAHTTVEQAISFIYRAYMSIDSLL